MRRRDFITLVGKPAVFLPCQCRRSELATSGFGTFRTWRLRLVMSVHRCQAEIICSLRVFRILTDAVEKVENRTTPKISQMLIFGLLRRCDALSVATKVHGRFSEKRCGPSRRCARNA